MKFTVTLSYVRGRWNDSPRVRPSVYYDETVVSEVKGESVTISFEQGAIPANSRSTFGHFATRPSAITKENVDTVITLLAAQLSESTLVDKSTGLVVDHLLASKGWGHDRENFDMLDNQEAWGFMGGTGCGNLIHRLSFTKVLGVKPSLTGTRRILAAMQFNGWLGQVKAIRDENKHLRDLVTEDQLFVSYNAHPICQSSVNHWSARGFVVGSATESNCSCSKCAKKLGISVGKTPEAPKVEVVNHIEYKGYRIEFAKQGSNRMRMSRIDGAVLNELENNQFINAFNPDVTNTTPALVSTRIGAEGRDKCFIRGQKVVDKYLARLAKGGRLTVRQS